MPQTSVQLYAVFKRIQFKKLSMYKNMKCRPLQWENKIEYISIQNFMRYAYKQCINNDQIQSWPIISVLKTFEANKSINIISKLGCPILDPLKSISSILKSFWGLRRCQCII